MATTGGPSPLDCGVCMEKFSLTEHIPKLLPCGHSFCNICLENIVSAGSIPCPVCKQNCTVPVEGVQGFSTVYAILDMVDYSCSRCQKLGQTSRCPHCPLNMCTTCLDDHVQSEYSASLHKNLGNILSVQNEQQPKFNAFMDQIKCLYRNLDEFCEKASEVIKIKVNEDILKQLYEKSSQFSAAMKDVADLLARCRVSVDPDLPCFTLLKSAAKKLTPSDAKTCESSVKCVKSRVGSDTKSDTYTNIPHLVTGSQGRGPGQLQYPQGAAVDVHNGDVYVADCDNRRICVYGADYTYKSAFDVDHLPQDLCFTADGDISVTCDDHTVRIYRKSGTLEQTIGKRGKRKGEFDNPHGIVSDSDGHLYVCDRENGRVQVIDESGAVVRALGSSGPGQLEDPLSAAVHPLTKQVYVTDDGKKQVNIYNRDGQYVACIEKADIPEISNFRPSNISFRDDGLLCISDGYNNCIHLMRDGRVTQKIGKYGSERGQFIYPRGTTFSDTGDLILCDMWNNRLQIFCTD